MRGRGLTAWGRESRSGGSRDEGVQVAFFQVTSSRWGSRRRQGLGLDEGVAEGVGPARQIRDDTALVPALVVVLAVIDILGAESEHAVDEPRKLVGGGGDGFGRPETGFQAAVVGPERRVAVVEGAGGQAQGEFRPELRKCLLQSRVPSGAVGRQVDRAVRRLYDTRMRLTRQNAISDYDLGFTNFR